MTGYTKLAASILHSSIWSEDDRTRIVWITLLAMANQHGEVLASIPGVARAAGVPLEDAKRALDRFLAPDPYSRTPDKEGRRIEAIDGGWVLVNHAKYRAAFSRDDQKAKTAERVARHRAKAKPGNKPPPSNDPKPLHVTLGNAGNASVTQTAHIAEAEADADLKREREEAAQPTPEPPIARGNAWPNLDDVLRTCGMLNIPEATGRAFWEHFEAQGWQTGQGLPIVQWTAKLSAWWRKEQANAAEAKAKAAVKPKYRIGTETAPDESF